MTTTTAPARPAATPPTQPKKRRDEEEEEEGEFEDEFKTDVQDKATRWLVQQANPKDGKETATSRAAKFVKEFFDRFGWAAFEYVRGETAENRGDIDTLTDRVNEIDPPDFEEYLNKVLGFTIGADAYFKYVMGRMKAELDKAGVTGVFDDKGAFVQEEDLKHTASFAMILGEVHNETAEILAEEYGPEDPDEEGDDDDDDDDGDSGEGEPAEEPDAESKTDTKPAA